MIHTEGPEYDSTDALGPVVWNDDVNVIIEGNYLCNDLGLDTISTGKVIGFAMECHEKGIPRIPISTLNGVTPVPSSG